MCKTAVVLCGGKGTRFAPVSKEPKILVEFRKAPFLNWLVDYITTHGFTEIIFCVGYKYQRIIDHVRTLNLNISVGFIIEESQLGTGGAIVNCLNRIESKDIYVLNGDTFFTNKLPEALFMGKHRNSVVCLCKNFQINSRYGDFKIIDQKLIVTRGTMDNPIFNSSVYCGVARIPPEAKYVPLKAPFSTEEFLTELNYPKTIIQYKGDMIDFGVPKSFLNLKNDYDV
tara:strand:+ start:695 stop:1375 length:681 start_codon:yes stop_codon:yes gene_type:complete